MEIKLVVSYPNGKTEQKELKGEEAEKFIGYKIGESFEGSLVGIPDKLLITGGSDSDGFPMRKGVHGIRRIKLLLAGGVGCRSKDKGVREKKRVCSETITENIVQINTKIAPPAEKAPKKKTAPKKAVEEKVATEIIEEKLPLEEESVKEAPEEIAPPAEKAPKKKPAAKKPKKAPEEKAPAAKKAPKKKPAPKKPKKVVEKKNETKDTD